VTKAVTNLKWKIQLLKKVVLIFLKLVSLLYCLQVDSWYWAYCNITAVSRQYSAYGQYHESFTTWPTKLCLLWEMASLQSRCLISRL